MAEMETRTVTAEVEFREDAEAPTIVGHAATFDQPYRVGFFTEQIHRDAFKRTLASKPDVRLLINHEGEPLARTKSGTLELGTDSTGLTVRATLDPSDPDVQRLIPKMRRGDMDQMSFAFRVPSGGDMWDHSGETPLRTIREASLSGGDVSVVTYPANENASVHLRQQEAKDAALTLAQAYLVEMYEGRSVDPKRLSEVITALGGAVDLRTVGDSFNDTQQALRDALQAKFGGDDGDEPFDLYVQDAGDDWVVFTSYGDAGPGKGTWRVGYTVADEQVSIVGSPEQVVVETTYRPVSNQANSLPLDLARRLADEARRNAA